MLQMSVGMLNKAKTTYLTQLSLGSLNWFIVICTFVRKYALCHRRVILGATQAERDAQCKYPERVYAIRI